MAKVSPRLLRVPSRRAAGRKAVWSAGICGAISFVISLAAAQEISPSFPVQAEIRDRLVQSGNQELRAEKYAQAAHTWALAYAIAPEPSLLYNLADACRRSEQQRESVILFQRYLEEDPGTSRKTEVEDRLRAMQAQFSQEVAKLRAVQLAQEHVNHGVLSYSNKDFAQARDGFARAYALSPKPDLLYNLANALRKAGMLPEALALYQRYLQDAPLNASLSPNAEAYVSQLTADLQKLLDQQAKAAQQQRPVQSVSSPVQQPTAAPLPLPATLPRPAIVKQLRSRWTAYVEGTAGPLIGGRALRFSGDDSGSCQILADPSTRRYAPAPCAEASVPAVAGLQARLAVFPLAGVGPSLLRGLGIEGELELWSGGTLCGNADASGACSGGDIAVSQLRFAAGLEWDWNISRQRNGPTLSVHAHYGYTQSHIATPETATDISNLPSITYQYIEASLGFSAPLYRSDRVTVRSWLGAGYLAPWSYGQLDGRADGSPGSKRYESVERGHGVRVSTTLLEVLPWRGLVLQLTGAYQFFGLSLAKSSSASQAAAELPAFLAGGLSDHTYSAGLNIGYRY